MPPEGEPAQAQEALPASRRWHWRPLLLSLVLLFSGRSAREGYLAAIDQAVISLANFVATIILARNVTPTELGMYGVGFTALRLIRSIQEGLTIQPLNVFGAGMPEVDFKRYATSTSLIQVGLAVSSALVVAISGVVMIRLGNDTAGPVLFSLWFVFLWWQLQEYVRRLLYTRGAVFNAMTNTVLANAVRLALMVIWLSRGQLTGIAGLEAIAWGSLVALLPGLWQTRAYWTRSFMDLRQTWQRNWAFGRWAMGGTISAWVSVEFYPVLTAGLVSFAAAGAYRAIQNLVAPVHLILRAADTFLTPRAANSYDQSGKLALNRLLRRIYFTTGIPVLGILAIAVLFPEQLLHLLYGDTYLAYSQGVVLMAAFYALLYAYTPLQTALKAMRLSRPIFIANLIAIVCMFTIGIWMILHWGVYGTIAGQALNALLVTLILWAAWAGLSQKRKPHRPSR
jgi:O-antigen/teichoic acid export membrane protein